MFGLLVLTGGFFAGVLWFILTDMRSVKRASANAMANWGVVFAVFYAPIFGRFGGTAAGLIFLLWHYVRWRTLDLLVGWSTLLLLNLSFPGLRALDPTKKSARRHGGQEQ